jgi:hypothetical protein
MIEEAEKLEALSSIPSTQPTNQYKYHINLNTTFLMLVVK